MPALFTNYASAPLAASISAAATSISITTGSGALFPTITAGGFFYATLTNSSNQLEIVKVTARAGDVFTVVRAQEGTIAKAYSAADKIELRVTAASLENFVQLDGTQTITGVKTFSGGIVGNLTGNVTGNLIGDVTGNVTGNLIGDVTGNATTSGQLVTTNFSIVEAAGKLVVKYGGTVVASIASSGAITSANDMTAFGTV